MTTGIPINLSSFWHSAFCSLVTRTCRRFNLSISSTVPARRATSKEELVSFDISGESRTRRDAYVPVSFASSSPALASSLFSNRLLSYEQARETDDQR